VNHEVCNLLKRDLRRNGPDVAENIRKFYEALAISADSFARAVSFAMSLPEDVDVIEILFRPTCLEL